MAHKRWFRCCQVDCFPWVFLTKMVVSCGIRYSLSDFWSRKKISWKIIEFSSNLSLMDPKELLRTRSLFNVSWSFFYSCVATFMERISKVYFGGYIPQTQILEFVINYRIIYRIIRKTSTRRHTHTHSHASISHSQYWTSWNKRRLIVKIWGQYPTLILCN